MLGRASAGMGSQPPGSGRMYMVLFSCRQLSLSLPYSTMRSVNVYDLCCNLFLGLAMSEDFMNLHNGRDCMPEISQQLESTIHAISQYLLQVSVS